MINQIVGKCEHNQGILIRDIGLSISNSNVQNEMMNLLSILKYPVSKVAYVILILHWLCVSTYGHKKILKIRCPLLSNFL